MDTSDPKEWSHPNKIGKDDNCPQCGYGGGGHITVFVDSQIGRRCLECSATWPVSVTTEKVPSGCLGCNTQPITDYFVSQGYDVSAFSEVPRPRHDWGDVVCCDDCGRAWLIDRSKLVKG